MPGGRFNDLFDTGLVVEGFWKRPLLVPSVQSPCGRRSVTTGFGSVGMPRQPVQVFRATVALDRTFAS